MKIVDLEFYTDGAFTSTSAGAVVVVINREGLIVEEEPSIEDKILVPIRRKFWQYKAPLS